MNEVAQLAVSLGEVVAKLEALEAEVNVLRHGLANAVMAQESLRLALEDGGDLGAVGFENFRARCRARAQEA